MAEKKKTELAQKSRKEIAEYLNSGKLERARIRVEHIIREDYLVEVSSESKFKFDFFYLKLKNSNQKLIQSQN